MKRLRLRRRWLLWLLIIAFVWVVITRFTEIQKLADTLAQGLWQWVLAAALFQVLYYIVYTTVYKAAFHTVEVESKVSELLPVFFSSIFVAVVAPTGGASMAALFMDDAARRGQSAARTAAGFVLVLVADFFTFGLILIIGLLYLFAQHDLQPYQIVGTLALLAMIGSLTGVLMMGVWQPLRLRRLLNWVQRFVNHTAALLKRPAWLADDWADRNASEMSEAALAMMTYPQRLLRTLAAALGTHLCSIASLYALFMAFQEPIQFGPLVAGFAMGELFLIVSPTPWGIGVVEGVMVLVYSSLGVPTETAAVVTLAYRGLSLWLPLAIGFFLLRRVKSFGEQEHSRAELSSVRAVAILTALMGLVSLVSSVTPSASNRLAIMEQMAPIGLSYGGHLIIALAGFALLLLAFGLWRRKRLAWLLTLIILDVSIVTHLVKGLDYEEAIAAAALATWLWVLYPHFHARLDPVSARQWPRALLAAVLYTLAYGTLGFYMLGQHFGTSYSPEGALQQTVTLFTHFRNPGVAPLTSLGQYFVDSVYIVAAVTFVYALLLGLRPAVVPQAASPAEREQARYIVMTHGRSPLARLTLLNDKSYYFSAGGSLVAYVPKGRVALALGDPIGPPADVAAAIGGFQAHCAVRDWQPAFYQAGPDHLSHYRSAGFETLCIGHEGITDLSVFSLEDPSSWALRSHVNRLTELGYRCQIYSPLLPDSLLHELRAVSDEWLRKSGSPEKRFASGWFDDDYLRTSRVITVRDPDGSLSAFANILPEYQSRELALDLIRYRHELQVGTMEFMFVNLIRWASAQGYTRLNLGLTVSVDVNAYAEDRVMERSLHYLSEHLTRFYKFKVQRPFQEQFKPEWSPRYLVYPGRISLPSVVLALIRADSDDGLWSGYFKDLIGTAS